MSDHEPSAIANTVQRALSAAGLHYADDRMPGYSRLARRDKFIYLDTSGRPIRDQKIITRINALAIPPAYEQVWICPDPVGHIQATARDARGRKQYRYNALWNSQRDSQKYSRLLAFATALPAIRRRVERDLRRRDFGREHVLAAVIRILDRTVVRIGNRKYAKANRSFGLTTLRNSHTEVLGSEIRFRFRGKSGIDHDVKISDPRVARVVRRCLDIPGQDLFQWLDPDGCAHPVASDDVNAYLRSAGGDDFSAKDYRTWAGSVLAFELLQQAPPDAVGSRQKFVAQIVKDVARRLSNTPAICRRCYIHPKVIECFIDGSLPKPLTPPAPRLLRAPERRFLSFLTGVNT